MAMVLSQELFSPHTCGWKGLSQEMFNPYLWMARLLTHELFSIHTFGWQGSCNRNCLAITNLDGNVVI